LKHTFSNATPRALSNHHKKRTRNFAEALTCEVLTYTVNTVKPKYLPVDKARAANILTLLVWRLVLSFDINMSYLREGQDKQLHC